MAFKRPPRARLGKPDAAPAGLVPATQAFAPNGRSGAARAQPDMIAVRRGSGDQVRRSAASR